jgi:hypothetical protein
MVSARLVFTYNMTGTMIPGCTGYRRQVERDDQVSWSPHRNRERPGPGALGKAVPGLMASSEDR